MPYWHIFTLTIDRTFTNLEGEQKNIRTVTRNSKEWFVASDVCKALGIANTADATVKVLPSESFARIDQLYTKSENPFKGPGSASLVVLTEDGLYRLLMRSDKPNARPFQDWVTKVVLPTIRKEGVYIRGEEKIAKVSR